ncbi:MAG: TVP38/TMEM64 family protein [Myxococcota bacterium]
MPETRVAAEGCDPVSSQRATYLRVAVGLLALAGLVWLGHELGGRLPAFAAYIEGLGVWGPLVFVLGYALAVVGFLPGSVLTLAGGALFGIAEGTVLVFVAAVLGSSLAFFLARHVARGALERRLSDNARFTAIDRAVARQGRRIVFLLRLSPVFPFSLLNYALGLTRVSFADYTIASLGMIPGTLLYVYAGRVLGSVAALAGGAQPATGPLGNVLLGVGLVATLIVTRILTRIARQALEEATHG